MNPGTDTLDGILRRLYLLESLVDAAGMSPSMLRGIVEYLDTHSLNSWRRKPTDEKLDWICFPLSGGDGGWEIVVRRRQEAHVAFSPEGVTVTKAEP